MWPQVAVDRCTEHPGVKWIGPRPCFCCDPAAWEADPPPPMSPGHEPPPDAASIPELVAEMLAARVTSPPAS
jgi:hypothetical protein